MSIVSGAVAGRMKLIPFFIFAIVLTGVIYPIQGYWNWGGGFLNTMGYSDYAGSGTVHLCVPLILMVRKLTNRQQDAKIHTSIIAQNLHNLDKHHHLLSPALAIIAAFKRRTR